MAVTVIKGEDLVAKDRPSLFRRRASSDPYFVIRFKNKTYTSEYKAQTLNPNWKSSGFDLGFVTEVEACLLTIEVFDYDTISSDDFMGMVQVPGSSLFSLGPGEHTDWFQLDDSEKYKRQAVSGKILVSFNVKVPCKTLCRGEHCSQSCDSVTGDRCSANVGLKRNLGWLSPTLKANSHSCCSMPALTNTFSCLNERSFRKFHTIYKVFLAARFAVFHFLGIHLWDAASAKAYSIFASSMHRECELASLETICYACARAHAAGHVFSVWLLVFLRNIRLRIVFAYDSFYDIGIFSTNTTLTSGEEVYNW